MEEGLIPNSITQKDGRFRSGIIWTNHKPDIDHRGAGRANQGTSQATQLIHTITMNRNEMARFATQERVTLLYEPATFSEIALHRFYNKSPIKCSSHSFFSEMFNQQTTDECCNPGNQ